MNVMVIAAHPDDELLGVGGTILKHTRAGDSVLAVIVGEGATSRGTRAGEVEALNKSALKAAEVLGVAPPVMLGFPDNRLDSVDMLDVVQSIEALIAQHKPSVVYTHHSGDLNIDHRIVHDVVRTACRPLPGSPVREIYAFETVSSTEWGSTPFFPTRFVEITDELSEKLKALACYESEMRSPPHARSLIAVDALAKTRGANVGVLAAEAFEVVMQLVKN